MSSEGLLVKLWHILTKGYNASILKDGGGDMQKREVK